MSFETSGKLFNEKHSRKSNGSHNYIFCKILAEDLIHNNFKYSEGLNIDIIPFNPSDVCSSGGLYFCSIEKFYLYTSYGKKFAFVIIPDDARVYTEHNKYKSDKIILTKIINLNDLNLSEFLTTTTIEKIIRHDGLSLKYIGNQSEEMCKLAVKQNGYALQYVIAQNDDICALAVRQDGNSLRYVIVQNDNICKLAVENDAHAIAHVHDQTPELCKLAVEQNGLALEYVIKQTPEICQLAIKQNWNAYKYIKNYD